MIYYIINYLINVQHFFKNTPKWLNTGKREGKTNENIVMFE